MARAPDSDAQIARSIPQLKVSPQVHADLQHLSDLLHLLHHRNHNQHRRSAWYRHFSTFRRHFNHLLAHLDVLAEQPTTNLGRHRKKAVDAKTHVLVQQELMFWRDVMVAKWWWAFSQVVADGRFAVLGVVLLAVLSDVSRKVGMVGVFEAMGEEEVRKVLEKFGREEYGEVDSEREEGVKIKREKDGVDEDFGEVLRRNETDDSDAGDRLNAKVFETEIRNGENSACMAPEQDVLKQSREALKRASGSASPASLKEAGPKSSSPAPSKLKVKKNKSSIDVFKADRDKDSSNSDVSKPMRKSRPEAEAKPDKKREAKDRPSTVSKPLKKKKKKNAIDDLFSGL